MGAAVAAGCVVALIAGWIFLREQDAAEARARAADEVDHALKIKDDPSEAMSLARAALERYPDDARLHHLLGLAQHRRGRYTDSIASFEKAQTLASDPGLAEEIAFDEARSRMRRFLETKDHGDFNLSMARLRDATGAHAAEGRILLGLALAADSDERDPARARALLEEGLAAAGKDVEGLEQARATLARLEEDSNEP